MSHYACHTTAIVLAIVVVAAARLACPCMQCLWGALI